MNWLGKGRSGKRQSDKRRSAKRHSACDHNGTTRPFPLKQKLVDFNECKNSKFNKTVFFLLEKSGKNVEMKTHSNTLFKQTSHVEREKKNRSSSL